jgi:hypothetical protein
LRYRVFEKDQERPRFASRQQIPRVAIGIVGNGRGHRQHAPGAERPLQHRRPAVAQRQHGAGRVF